MYARDVKGTSVTLGVSGMLWESNLVMVDEETESLWSQMMGTSMRGPLAGNTLENIPALMTNWRTWKAKHPRTTVFFMPRTSGVYNRDVLAADGDLGIGLVIEGEAKFWDFGQLHRHSVINDRLGRASLLAVIDKDSLTPAIYSRRLGTRDLNFHVVDGRLTDVETDSTWDLLTGRAIDGELAGQTLHQLSGFTSNATVWSRYFPNTAWDGKTSEQTKTAE